MPYLIETPLKKNESFLNDIDNHVGYLLQGTEGLSFEDLVHRVDKYGAKWGASREKLQKIESESSQSEPKPKNPLFYKG